MQQDTVRGPKRRDTGWKRDGKAKGVYWRKRSDGTKAWGYYAWGRINSAVSREQALAAKAKAQLDKSVGRPAPNPNVLVRDLAEDVRQAKKRRLRRSSFATFEDALDRIVLPEFGHLKAAQITADRLAGFIRDLEARGLSRSTIEKYLQPLSASLSLAIRRGVIPLNPLELLSPDERPQPRPRRTRFEWSADAISRLIAAAEEVARRPEARYNYAPLIQLLVLTGLRVGEALALRWEDIDLLDGTLHVRYSLARDKTLGEPKTKAGTRDMPLSPGLVDVLVKLKPDDARDDHFVFANKLGKPLGYWNFRNRGFYKTIESAGFASSGVTIHDLRHAAASLYIAPGLTPVEVAAVLGHADASVTLRVYAHLFDRGDVAAKIRAAQASLGIT